MTLGQLFLDMKICKNPETSPKRIGLQSKWGLQRGAMSSVVKRLINLGMLSIKSHWNLTRGYNRLVVTDLGKTVIKDYEGYVN